MPANEPRATLPDVTNPANAVDSPASIERPASRAVTPLTGRDTEVSLLTDRWEQAQEGMGQVVSIVGEAGLGKSRLVETIKQHVEGETADPRPSSEATTVIEWRCAEPYQNTGLHPIADCLRRIFDFQEDDSSASRFERLAEHLEGCGFGRPDFVALFAKLLFLPSDERFSAPELTPAREREETFRAVHEWLGACSGRRPILFIVEDLHWIDASTLEFLQKFISEGLHDRILTVLTFRPEFHPPWPAMAHQTNLALNCLTKRQVAELMRNTAGGMLPDSLVLQVFQRTRGVPLLVEEFGRMAQETAAAGGVREMPGTLQELVTDRLNVFSIDRNVVHLAAMLGREFHFEKLAAVCHLPEPALRAELEKLEAADILFRKGYPPRCIYLFRHALLEEAISDSIEPDRQRELHKQVAESMESHFAISNEIQPEWLAHHFTRAGLVEKAVAYWLLAGKRSHERYANIEAISHFKTGLELLRTLAESSSRDAWEMEFLAPMGACYIAARGYAALEVGPLFERACNLAGKIGTAEQVFVMLRGHFAYHIVRGHFLLCADIADRTVLMARTAGDAGMLMEALFLEGLTRFYRGNFVGARSSFEEALQNYDNRERTRMWALRTGEDSGVTHRCYLALTHWHLGSPAEAFAVNRQARDLARTLNHPFSLEYALHHTGWLYQHCRLGTETSEAGDEQIRIANEQGFLFWNATGTLYFAAGWLLRGRLEEGLQLFQQGLSAYRATGAALGLPYYLGVLGEAFLRTGKFDEAHTALTEALGWTEENDEHFHQAEIHRLLGELHLARSGDAAAAMSQFEKALDIARSQQSCAWELRAAMSIARIQTQQTRRNDALALLTTTLDCFERSTEIPDLAEAAALVKELGNEQMRDDINAGIKYVRDRIPAPMSGPVSVDWRYVPATTLGGDALGYHWVDEEHLAIYMIDVTGHGLDSALLSVTISNAVRSGTFAGADPRKPDQVLAWLNRSFPGERHGGKYFTAWYGIYHRVDRILTYASGGHPSAVLLSPGQAAVDFSATGPIMGALRESDFPAKAWPVPRGARLYVFSDGAYEVRRDGQTLWGLGDCISYLKTVSQRSANAMDDLLAHVRELHGSTLLDDDFSIIEIRME